MMKISTMLCRSFLLCLAVFACLRGPAFATEVYEAGVFDMLQSGTIRVSGKVLDVNGSPIIGATVIAQGTTIGAIADSEGNYTLNNVPSDAVLEFSFMGYVKLTKKVDDQTVINAILYEDSQSIEGVEVVAFGTQKKESVIGAITTISARELKTPSSNLTNALAGRVAGVISYQRSGEPGVDDASFFVRGVTTFGYKKDPLILIDGLELSTNDLARLQPDDIESFSIMKDATATALYGARGANGVILVKTKEGRRGEVKVNFRFENSFSAPTREIDLADPVTFMRLHNEAYVTRGEQPIYSDLKIDNTIPGSGSLLFPATDWRKELLKDFTVNQRANLNVSGGGNVARYYVAASYSKDNGILKDDKSNNYDNNINLNIYTLRSNVNIDLTKTTELVVRLSGTFEDYKGPLYSGSDMYGKIMQSNPVLFPAKYPAEAAPYANHILFGNAEDGQYLNPYAELVRGYKEYGRSNMGAQFEVKQDLGFITEGLSVRGMFSTSRISYYELSRYMKPFYYKTGAVDYQTGEYSIVNINPDDGTDYLVFDDRADKTAKRITSNIYFEGAANYNREFGRHGVSALLVYQLRNNHQPNANSLQESLPFRNIGLSGRATYSFDSRYFAEFNFGYNGSERFYKTNRFGFFPSAGLAWMVSNEKFFENLRPVVSKLKARVSYGLVGNDDISSSANRFLYLSEMNMNSSGYGAQFGYEANGDQSNGIQMLRYANPEITWEKSKKANYALELSLWNDLNIIAEYYTEKRTSIYMRRSIPASMGLWENSSAPLSANVGEAKGSGFDLSVDYNKYFSNRSWLQLRGNFTYAKSEYLKYEEPVYPGAWWKQRVGYSTSQTWGYIAEGLFIDDQEVANSPAQFGDYGAGDIKYRDVNGDGVIDELDMVPIGFPTEPEIVYGFGASFGFRNWDFSLFFQGLARESFWISYNRMSPFFDNTSADGYGRTPVGHNALARVIADSYWSESNRDVYAMWPRLSTRTVENNNKTNTWFMRDGSFLRLKQVELGYTLPNNLTSKIGIQSLRVYFSGTNLLCFSKFKMWDPEMAGSGMGYPVQRVYNIGINLNF